MTTLVGGSYATYSDGVGGVAGLVYPTKITVDESDNVYITDYYNSAIRRIKVITGN